MASLEERFSYKELDYFLEVGDDSLEGNNLADEATGDVFVLLWEVVVLPAEKALPCFWE